MISPHLKFAFKSVRKHKAPSIINFLGFVIGLTGAVLLLAILQHDLKYDRYHDTAANVYRMSIRLDLPNGQRHFGSTSVISAENLAEAIPEVVDRVRFRMMTATMRLGDQVFSGEPVTLVDPAYYQAFKVDLVNGKLPETRDQILISSRAAERLFNDKDPVGQVIDSEGAYGRQGLLVTGVFESYPTNVSFRPSFLAHFDLIEELHNRNHGAIMPGLSTFILATPQADAALLNRKLSAYYEENLPDNLFNVLKHEVEPYHDMHFTSGLEFDLGQKHDPQTLWILGLLAAFIIASTLINYFNMQTALAVQRVKELSIKKALGQSAANKVQQSFFEALVLLLPAFLLSSVLIRLALGSLEEYTELSLSNHWLAEDQFPVLMGLLFLAFWLVAALVSVLLLNANQQKAVLGRSKPANQWVRRSLIGLQFALAGFFIFSALVISGQLKYMESRDLGYEQEGLVNIPLTRVRGYQDAVNIKQQVASVAGVRTASISQSAVFGAQGKLNFAVEQDTGTVSFLLNYNYVDEDFLSTNQMVLTAGEGIPADRKLLVINEQAVKALGFASADAALGAKMTVAARDTSLDYTIGGVISDYHYATMHQMIEPIVLFKNERGGYYNLSVKTESLDYQQVMAGIEDKWDELFPGHQLDYRVMTDVLDRAYQEDNQKGSFYQWATLLLVVISALGIFGLTYYYADQKRKEIGIRKAIGAQLSHILMQVGKPIAIICAVAAVVIIPVAHYLSTQWLGDYQYRISIGAREVLITVLLMLALSGIALLYPGLKASRINPVDALREE